MAISYRGHSSANTTVNATTTLTRPAITGVTTGDYLLTIIGTGNITITPPTGWTNIAALTQLDDDGLKMSTYQKVATGPDTADTWTFPGITGKATIISAAYTGVNTTTPIVGTERAINQHISPTTATRTTPTITTAAARWIIYAFATGSGYTWTAPATVRHQLAAPSGASLVIGDSNADQPAGTYSRSATQSTATLVGVSAILALNPATSSPTPTINAGGYPINIQGGTGGPYTATRISGATLTVAEDQDGVFRFTQASTPAVYAISDGTTSTNYTIPALSTGGGAGNTRIRVKTGGVLGP